MIRVLVADDHTVVRAGIRKILSETGDILVVDEASNGQEAVDKIWDGDFDVILLDISMPRRSGLDILKQLVNDKPRVRVLVISVYPEEHYAVRVLRAGGYGYLTKESAPDEMIRAVRRVASGKKYVSPSLAEKLASHLEIKTPKPVHEMISDREYEVMCLLASGKTLREIAEQMSLSVKTISTYRSRIMEKTKMKSNAELIHYAIQNRLVQAYE